MESISEEKGATVAVVHETGPLGWVSEAEPGKVLINGCDVTEKVERKDRLYTIPLAEASHKMVLFIEW